MGKKLELSGRVRRAWEAGGLALGAGLFFMAVCLCSRGTIKPMAVLLIVSVLCTVFLFYGRLRDRLSPPILALGLVVLMDGLSSLYAVSGKFVLYEFLKVLAASCMALLLLAFTGGRDPGRQAAVVLEGCCAITGLVSIDLLSTRWIGGPVLALLGQFTLDYTDMEVVEEGVRLLSIFEAPNPFAGIMGIGVLLSLGLAVSAERPAERAAHLACLSVNALAFVLAFSMGACVTIVPAFLVLLALTGRERRAGMLLLMVETLAVTMLAASPISMTSMTAWDGSRPVPLLCTVGGAVALCALELLVGRRAAERLRWHSGAVLGLTAGILAGAAALMAAACLLTGGVELQAGEGLRRAARPAPGTYAVTVEGDGDPSVTVESQDREDTMMHTSTVLYSGPLSQAAFTVPEGSLAVYFSFRADGPVRLDAVRYEGEGGSGAVPLGYPLLPDFIANRLQGLWANQNAIQRLVFFEDGLKLFRRSPLLGLGLGGFENGARSVQSFDYATKYVHDHYIQALVDTGIVGLALFLGLLAVSAAAVWRGRERPLAPALGAALVFMAGHGAVEVDFSYYAFLPVAFGTFAAIGLCCGDALPLPSWAARKGVRAGALLGGAALMAVFGVLLNCNMAAQGIAQDAQEFSDLERAVALDRFEWADHMLSYVLWASDPGVDGEVRQKADGYAARLGELKSNSLPLYLAGYYLETGRPEQGLEMAEQYVDYLAASPAAWQEAFDLLEQYERDTPEYRAGVCRIAARLEAWNGANLGSIELDGETMAFLQRMGG